MSKERYFKVRVTIDTTQTGEVPVKAATPQLAEDIGTSWDAISPFRRAFEFNEGNNHMEEAYLGDLDSDVAEISREEYEAMVPPSAFSKTLYLKAFCRDDSMLDPPDFAQYALNESALGEILRLHHLCVSNSLSECRVYRYPDWNTESSIDLQELVVDKTAFWFSGREKHSDAVVETLAMEISDLMTACHGPETEIYSGPDLDDLREAVRTASVEADAEQGEDCEP